jgi:hypothetical protein
MKTLQDNGMMVGYHYHRRDPNAPFGDSVEIGVLIPCLISPPSPAIRNK